MLTRGWKCELVQIVSNVSTFFFRGLMKRVWSKKEVMRTVAGVCVLCACCFCDAVPVGHQFLWDCRYRLSMPNWLTAIFLYSVLKISLTRLFFLSQKSHRHSFLIKDCKITVLVSVMYLCYASSIPHVFFLGKILTSTKCSTKLSSLEMFCVYKRLVELFFNLWPGFCIKG